MPHPTQKLCHLLAIPLLVCAGALQAAPDFSALPRTESPNLRKVKPPQAPQVFNEHRPGDEIDRLPLPEQPKELTTALLDLEQGSIEERIAKLKRKAVADLVYVRGGSFWRGDFSKKIGSSLSFTPNLDDKFLKEITLSDFWIGKYKVTYAEFDVFTDATKRPRTGMEYDGDGRHPLVPAGAYWPEAKSYCLWLGEITGYPFDLPTEAQWEYAARSRGQFFATATDDGNWDKDRNAPSMRYADNIAGKYIKISNARYPVGLFPSNPLGLHDMALLTWEWVNDWYAEDAYEKAEARDPQGPASGEKKVYRSWLPMNGQILGTNIWRQSEKPIPDGEVRRGKYRPYPTSFSPTLRCVVNSTAKQP